MTVSQVFQSWLRDIARTKAEQSASVVCWCLFYFLLFAFPLATRAQAPAEDQLLTEQEVVTGQYRNFEAVLQRMADLLQTTDPDRARVVRQILARSKKDLIPSQFQSLIDRLKKEEWKEATDEQALLLENLNDLLDMMLSENRGRRLEEERKRVEQAIREVRQLERRQQEIRGKTERAPADAKDPFQELTEDQEKLAKEAANLAETLDPDAKKQDLKEPLEPKTKSQPKAQSEPNDPNSEPKESSESSSEPSEQETKPGTKGDSSKESKETPNETEPKPSEGSNPSEGQQGSSGGDSSKEPAPGKQSIEKAAEAMKRAQEKLEGLQQEPATEEQEKAIEELQKAIEELEEVLRQLREEERIERLASLEVRCRKMLEMQETVFDATLRLDRVPKEKRTRIEEQQAAALARKEQEIGGEAEQALLVLREDGTAIAFYEAFTQVRDDVVSVTALLSKSEVGTLTQGIEQDVIATLEEMIGALKREIAAGKKKKGKQEGGKGPQQNPPLVERIAELKLVRSMQARVNQRTTALAGLENPRTTPDFDAILLDLAKRQARIHAITRDLAQEQSP